MLSCGLSLRHAIAVRHVDVGCALKRSELAASGFDESAPSRVIWTSRECTAARSGGVRDDRVASPSAVRVRSAATLFQDRS